MHPDSILDQLDRLIAERSILEHPFYRAWNDGALTGEQLATYARSYYPHVAAFPGYLEAALETTDDGEIRAELADNLREELSEPAPHPQLWLDFAAGCGCDRREVADAESTAATAETVAAFRRLAEASAASALAALYAYESQQPEVARLKADGLCQHYGIDAPEALAYFEVHAEADVRHRDGERRALARALENGATGEEVLDAARQALNAYWGLLDGVCRQTGIPLSC
jgi:pyrroloquinoline-quinone synthase